MILNSSSPGQRLFTTPDAAAEAAHRLASELYREGRWGDAADAIGKAIRLAPCEPRYRVSLAAALGRLGKHNQAVAELKTVLLNGGGRLPELHNNLGASLQKLGRLDEAAAAFSNAVALRGDYIEARRNLAGVLQRLSRPVAAAEAYDATLALCPSDSESLWGLASVLAEAGDAPRAIVAGRKLVAANPESAKALSSLLYTLHYSPDVSAESLYREAAEWGRRFCDPLVGTIRPHENTREPERPLRIGFLSPDLREHTVTKFVSAIIQHHDRNSFEVTCYSDAERPDHVTERVKQWAENWRESRALDDSELDKVIRQDRIDILVDLRGHAADNRLLLLARKPAPVQMNMVGYFNTTGLRAMDYRLSDRYMTELKVTRTFNR